MKNICNDLKKEYEALDTVVAGLKPWDWEIVTPFGGWTVKDEISHLAYFDRAAFLSATDKKAFNKNMEEMFKDFVDHDQTHDKVNSEGRNMDYQQLLNWWRFERNRLILAYEQLEPKARLPWYGPSMSAISSATARLMETWAHGQDIYDALNLTRKGTDRLKHIAHLGVSTLGWSFSNRGLNVPDISIYIKLLSPSNEIWTWGAEDAGEYIKGQAQDFCLIVTRRRHPDDTKIQIQGNCARQWMLIAQAFAGPPED